jgi:hypothetical protein
MAEHTSGLTLRGLMIKEGPEAVTLKIGTSLFEIQRSYVENLREVEEAADGKVVEVKIAPNASMIQRVLASAPALLAARMPIAEDGGACNCACKCNCACDCACGGGSREQVAANSSFRSPMTAAA